MKLRNYNVIDVDEGSYLCRHRSWKIRPRVYWSKFPDRFNERIRFTLFGAYWQRFVIKLLASDINTEIVNVNEG